MAQPESPIAVFIHEKKLGLVAVFAETVKTKEIAVEQNRHFIGIFHKYSHLYNVESILNRAQP